MNDVRDLNLNIKVSESEKERMHAKAAAKGLTLSAYIRFLILSDK